MTKTPFFFAFLFAVAIVASGCTVYTTAPPLYVERRVAWHPGYVYAYEHGCWADDVWYAPCPVSPGAGYGYYVYVDGGYRWHRHVVWEYRPGHPPPRWGHHPPPPPRVHRRHEPAHPHRAPPPRRF
jgi:hypothetical protein